MAAILHRNVGDSLSRYEGGNGKNEDEGVNCVVSYREAARQFVLPKATDSLSSSFSFHILINIIDLAHALALKDLQH
jgi:hypothetical protein